MKKFLAMTLVVMIAMASGFAQTSKPAATTNSSIVNHAAVQKAASNLKITPAIVVTGTATPGYLPVFTDALGDVGNSTLFQAASGNIGIGTTTPAFNLDIVSSVDPAAIAIEGYGTVGVNFIGRRARGTQAAPSGLVAGDNIMTMQGRGYGTTGFSPGSRAYMKFFAAETWTDTAQGSYIALATTQIGTSPTTTPAPERVRITDVGYVGILTTTPTSPLTVNGKIQSLGVGTGGFVFPDSTVQTTAAVSGVVLTSPGGSITVGGTATAPTVVVNPAIIPSGTCAVGSAVTAVVGGTITCGTIGAGGTLANVPVVVAQTSFTGVSGLSSPATLYTSAADGFYRVSVYMNSPLPLGTCAGSCTGEEIVLNWSDGVATASQSTTNCSLAGPCGSSYVASIWVANGAAITAYGQTTGAGSVPSGSYTARFLVEKL